MSSTLSSALAKLDGSIQDIHFQLDRLGAALEVEDAHLSKGLTDARYHAAKLRELIRLERPDANWADRRDLSQLIHELEVAAVARQNQHRRTKLLDLANELDAGTIRHRFETRTTALNTLRAEVAAELRREAAVSEPVKELPGPGASEWLHWAFNLQEAKDGPLVAELRRNFVALERFAGEMEEGYWTPAQPVPQKPGRGSGPSARATEALNPESPAVSSTLSCAPGITLQPPQNGTAEFDNAVHGGTNDDAGPSGYEGLLSEAPPATKSPRRASASRCEPVTPSAGTIDSSLIAAIAAAPHIQCCDNCGGTFPAEFLVCPFDHSELRLMVDAKPGTTTLDSPSRPDKTAETELRGKTLGESPATARQPKKTEPFLVPTVDKKAPEPPDVAASAENAKSEFERLKTLLAQRSAEDEKSFKRIEKLISRSKAAIATGVATSVVALGMVFAFAFNLTWVNGDRLRNTVIAAQRNFSGVVPDAEIQKDLEEKLLILKGSSIEAEVEDGVVTLVGQTPSEWDSVHAESLALHASGVKLVRNQVQVVIPNVTTIKRVQGKSRS